jgi:sortase A
VDNNNNYDDFSQSFSGDLGDNTDYYEVQDDNQMDYSTNYYDPEYYNAHTSEFDEETARYAYEDLAPAMGVAPYWLGSEYQNASEFGEEESEAPEYKKPGLPTRILTIFADFGISLAILVVLYFVWFFVFTGVYAKISQAQLFNKASWDEPSSRVVATRLDSESLDKLDADNSPSAWCNSKPAGGELISRIYIPKFNSWYENEYVRNQVQGVDFKNLQVQGYGHLESSVMPGCRGNSVFTALRDTYGSSLSKIDELQNGDVIVIRTPTFWHIYKVYAQIITDGLPTTTIYEDPGKNIAPKNRKILTLSAVHPHYSLEKHFVVQALLDYTAPVKSGVPKELLDAN